MSSSEKTIERLIKTIETQVKTIEAMSNELTLLREQVAYLTEKLSKKSSPKTKRHHKQMNLFDDSGKASMTVEKTRHGRWESWSVLAFRC